MKGNVINYQRVVFREVNSRYLTVPACQEMHSIHTVALDFEDPLVFYTPAIKGHKTFMSHTPYLLLVHVKEFLANSFLPLFQEVLF